ncbi:hypothetical protein P3T73_12465 [Kiritimatiellota bacterium B12222]|nr:hypothetical protein P3T73_12465 [Kiritimatiellota bacterium B12222]
MKNRYSLSFPVLVFVLNTLTAFVLQADVLASYSFTTATGNPTTLDTNLTDGVLSWEGSLSAGFSSGTNSAYAFTANVPESLDITKYLEFTITATSGNEFSLDTLVFDLGGRNYSADNDYLVTANVRSDLDSYGSDLATFNYTVPKGLSSDNYGEDFTVNFTGSQFDNLSEITFRLYPSDQNDNGNNIYRYANITLNGSTAVIPEPGTASLVLLSVLGFIMCGRFSRRKK